MKISSILLGGTLAANTALIALFVAGSFSDGDAGSAGAAAASASAAAQPAARATSTTDTSADPESWTKLQTGDLPGMLARLRAEGFPPAMVRAIMAEQVRLQFAPRRAALNLKDNERPFWEGETQDPKTTAAVRAIGKEQDQALKDLLGPEAYADDAAVALLRRQFPNFTDDKIAAIQLAAQHRSEKLQELSNSGSISGADFTSLEKAQRAEIASVLTPQELEDYDLRTSRTANTLRRQLASFNPTEQEFRALFALQRPFDDQYNLDLILGAGGPTQDQERLMRDRSTAQRQLTEDIKTTLGEQRYAEYQRSTDGNYQQTARLVARLELPPETANQVYTVQQDMQQRVRTLQMDRNLAPADRNTQLAALATEAQAKITATLGPRGYDAYKQYGGSWLQQLQPRPTLPARALPAGGGGGG